MKIIKEICVIMWKKLNRNKNYQMQMNCISKNQIIDIIKENNGICVAIDEDFSAGSEYLGYRYIIQKSL